jgi:hypothetical protein
LQESQRLRSFVCVFLFAFHFPSHSPPHKSTTPPGHLSNADAITTPHIPSPTFVPCGISLAKHGGTISYQTNQVYQQETLLVSSFVHPS